MCGFLVACSSEGTSSEPNHADVSSGGQGADAGAPAFGGSGSGSGGAAGGSGGGVAVGGSGGVGVGGSGNLPGSSVSFDGTSYHVSIVARNVAPGGEAHVCVVVGLPNTERVWVNEILGTLSGGSHHLVVDRLSTGSALQLEPQECAPTMAGDDTRLIIAQQDRTSVTLPAGTAFSLEPGQRIFLQLHYFNSAGDAQDIEGTVDLVLADTGASLTEAKSMFTGSFSISIPPHGAGSAESFLVPTPESGAARHVFALTSHTHKLGVRSTIERVSSSDAPPTSPIHESLNWDEPPLTMFDPTLVFNGTDGLRLICNYQNDTEASVGFGTSVDQEMCFMWVYYFDR